jgi:hypothetical protein
MPMFELNRLVSYDDNALLAEMRRVATIIPSPYITQSAFDRYSRASSSVIRRRFGGWREALLRAGLADRYSGTAVSRKMIANAARVFSDEELLAELHNISERLGGKPVTMELFNQYATMNAETLCRRFGSWGAALRKANLSISNFGKRYSNDDYFENLLTVWTHYGRQPKLREMDQLPSQIPSGAYEGKWGGWTKALVAFLERANSDVCKTRQGESKAVRSTVKDEGSARLRRRVKIT